MRGLGSWSREGGLTSEEVNRVSVVYSWKGMT